MLVLDFSQPNFDVNQLKITNDFEQSIKDFLISWFDDTDFIIAQTSGSTGTPKQIRLSKVNMRKSARMTCKFLRLNKGDTALLAMPVTYIAGKLMLIRAIENGMKLICHNPTSSFIWTDFTNKFGSDFKSINFVALTPMQVEKSIDFVSYCDKLIIGGAPLSDKVKQDLYPFTNEVYETYAMTETITHIALKQIPNQKYPNVNPYFKVLDEVEIAQDERGCLIIKTPYDDLVVTTNDIVELIDDQNFNWIGRADNVINSGGIKLFPEQIEDLIKPYIDSAYFITSKKDELLGEKLVLVIEGAHKTIDLSKANLSKYQIPKEIIFVPEFERTESGKIRRNKSYIS
ncbi:MAG: AMP-binding protein [Weeksellaceae bacterium]|nr:AMP-binding protein [Weeksellaceae bacterium]